MNSSAAKIEKVSLESLSVFTRQMSFLLGSGISFASILSILEEQTKDIKLKRIVAELNNSIVSSGFSLSQSMSKFPGVFSPSYIGMIKAGEASGNMSMVVERLADNCEKELALIRKTKAALIYPFFVCIVAVLSVIFILKCILPLFMPMLLQSGRPLPLPTMILMNFTKVISNPYAILLFAAVVIILYWIITNYIKTPVGKLWWDRTIFDFPVVGNILKKIAIIRICRMLNMLYESGSGIMPGIKVLKNAAGNEYLKQEMDGVISRVDDGGTLGSSFGEGRVFPSIFKRMVATLDEGVEFDKILPKIVVMYELDVESTLDTAVALIEPFMIVFLGVVIAFIMLSVFLPIYGVIGGQ